MRPFEVNLSSTIFFFYLRSELSDLSNFDKRKNVWKKKTDLSN